MTTSTIFRDGDEVEITVDAPAGGCPDRARLRGRWPAARRATAGPHAVHG